MKAVLRWVLLVLLAAVALQLYFVGRIALMVVVDPQSTAFQRSEAYRLATEKGELPWRQQWVPYAELSVNLKRAVIASEDATFVEHEGVDLDPNFARETLRNLQLVWKRPVGIITKGEGKSLLLRHDGQSFTEKKIEL